MNCLRKHMCWQSKRFYWEVMPGQKAVGEGNPGGFLCHLAHSLRFYGEGISFWVVSDQSLWLRVLPGGACIAQAGWMPARRIQGDGWTCGVTFWPFPNASGWWWLTHSMFLTRTSCHKTTHTNGYYDAWPGWGAAECASFNNRVNIIQDLEKIIDEVSSVTARKVKL